MINSVVITFTTNMSHISLYYDTLLACAPSTVPPPPVPYLSLVPSNSVDIDKSSRLVYPCTYSDSLHFPKLLIIVMDSSFNSSIFMMLFMDVVKE